MAKLLLQREKRLGLCCYSSAVGKLLPPVMMFPRVHLKDHMINGAYPKLSGLATQSGWLNSESFLVSSTFFVNHMGSSVQSLAVFFMDNHESHLSVEVIEMERANAGPPYIPKTAATGCSSF